MRAKAAYYRIFDIIETLYEVLKTIYENEELYKDIPIEVCLYNESAQFDDLQDLSCYLETVCNEMIDRFDRMGDTIRISETHEADRQKLIEICSDIRLRRRKAN